MLGLLSPEMICRSFLPLKIIFSGEKKNPTLVSSLELLWYLLLRVCARSGLGFVELWLGQVKTMFASQLHEKVLCHLLSLCLQNPLQIPWWLALEQEGSWCAASYPSSL